MKPSIVGPICWTIPLIAGMISLRKEEGQCIWSAAGQRNLPRQEERRAMTYRTNSRHQLNKPPGPDAYTYIGGLNMNRLFTGSILGLTVIALTACESMTGKTAGQSIDDAT